MNWRSMKSAPIGTCVLLTIAERDGASFVEYAQWSDRIDNWLLPQRSLDRRNEKPIAWQPLPAPFTGNPDNLPE